MHPFFWLLLPLFALVLVFLFYKAISFSFPRMGIPRRLVIPIFVAVLVGGFFNIPIWRNESTKVALNVGGAIIPLVISLYLLRKAPLIRTALAIAIVATVSGFLAEVDPDTGIRFHLGYLILPLTSVSLALILARRKAPQVAFISGTIGGIIGVDLLHLKELIDVGAGNMSIGGRGVFDGIFTTGVIAALLAGLLWRKLEPDGQVAE